MKSEIEKQSRNSSCDHFYLGLLSGISCLLYCLHRNNFKEPRRNVWQSA